MPKHTILFLAANPGATDSVKLGAEARALQVELERSRKGQHFGFEPRWAVTLLDLMRELRKLKPSIVHFSGHGQTGALQLVADAGSSKVVSADALADTFSSVSGVKLLVLDGCYAAPQAALVLPHVDVVVGTATAIGDDGARAFAAGLYGSLAAGESVQAAFRQGCTAIHLDPGDRQITRDFRQEGAVHRDVPHLDVRRGVDANRVLFS